VSRYSKINWVTCLVLVWFHVQAIAAFFSFTWTNLIVAAVLYWVAIGLGISMGYHRLHTHRGFKTYRLFEYFLAVCGTLTLEGGPIFWVATHRKHHQHSDQELDPHTPRVNGFWAHLGWIVFGEAHHNDTAQMSKYAPDLAKAAVVVPPSESVITGLSAAKDALYVRRMNGSTSDLLRVAHRADAKPIAVKLPFDADISALATDVRVPGVIYEASAWTRFGGFYFYDPRTSKVTDTGLQPEGPYDHPDDLVADLSSLGFEVESFGSDTLIVTPFPSSTYQILPVGLELTPQ
jgi:hypothetical protein